MKKEPVYQPRGTRDGTAGLKGRIVYVVVDDYGALEGIFVTRKRATYYVSRQRSPELLGIKEVKLR